MNSVIPLRAFVNPAHIPTLVLIDLQQEYLASPRVLAIPETVEVLENCRLALSHARAMGFPVAFVRWIGRFGVLQSRDTIRTLDRGLRAGSNRHGVRTRPAFLLRERVVRRGHGEWPRKFCHCRICRRGAACLSTAIEAFHRGHNFTFLTDASASHALDDISARDVHRTVSKIVSSYGDAATTQTWIAATSHRGKGWEFGNGKENGRTTG